MHKGDRGRVTVVGGSSGMTGAALHAARAALGAGAGLVKLVAGHDTLEAARETRVVQACVAASRLAGAAVPVSEIAGFAA